MAASVLNRLVAHRPRPLPVISLVVHEGLSLNGVRSACRDLEKRGLVLVASVPSQFDDVPDTLEYVAAPHATVVELPARGRRSTGRGDGSRASVLGALKRIGRPATLREVMGATGLGETGASKILKAALADGSVTRTPGPAPAVGSSRPWLWEVSRV
jgi:hypothetical protein